MGYKLKDINPRLAGGTQPTVNGPCLVAFTEYQDRLNGGGAERWQRDQEGSTSRQFRCALSDVAEGAGEFDGTETSYFVTLPATKTPERVARNMLGGIRLVYEAFGYAPEALDDDNCEVECGDDLVTESENGQRACGYWFAGDDDHWGKLLLLTPELHAQAVEGTYAPSKPKLRVKQDRAPVGRDDDAPSRAAEAEDNGQRRGPLPRQIGARPVAPVAVAPVMAAPVAPVAASPAVRAPTALPGVPGKSPAGSLRDALRR